MFFGHCVVGSGVKRMWAQHKSQARGVDQPWVVVLPDMTDARHRSPVLVNTRCATRVARCVIVGQRARVYAESVCRKITPCLVCHQPTVHDAISQTDWQLLNGCFIGWLVL